MSVFIFRLTLRQLARRKSTLLLIGLGAIPVAVALIFRFSDPVVDPERWSARLLLNGLVVTAVLPLTALILGTSALGDEIEDGTVIYLLAKPLQRWQILAPKVVASWLLVSVLVLASTITAGLIALDGQDSRLVLAFAAAVVLGALAYTMIFVLLSVVTSRALIVGLIYVFLWEGVITGIFTGTRYLSVRHYSLGIADSIANVDPFIFDAYVDGSSAYILISIVIVAGALLANRRLQTLEVREPT